MAVSVAKEKMLKVLQGLPEETTVEEAMERLFLLYKIERGIQQADAGQKVSHEEAKRRMRKWLE